MDATSPLSAFALRESERRAYEVDGFFARRHELSEDELDALREAAERTVAEAARSEFREEYRIDGNRYREAGRATIQYEHRDDSPTIRVIEPFHPFDPIFERLIDDPRLVAPMTGIIGCAAVALWTDKLNLKRPRVGSRFDWHQDSPYWTHVCRHVDRLPNVMVVLDDADEENGCFRVVRGSHRRGCLPGRQGEGTLGPLFTDPGHFDASQQVPIAVPAGSLVFFSPHTVHGSQPNRSDRPRRALVLTYQPGDHPMFKLERVRNARPRPGVPTLLG